MMEVYSEPATSFGSVIKKNKEHVEIIYTSLEEVISNYDAFLIDAYGVFWGSNELGIFPKAMEAMAYLVSQKKYVGIVSNSTKLSDREEERFQKYGLFKGIHYHFLLTSGEVTKQLLLQEALPFPTPRNTYWLFGSAHPNFTSHYPLFEGTRYIEVEDLREADFIHIATPHIEGRSQENSEAFREAVDAITPEIPILCVNPDRVVLEKIPPRLVIRQGSIAQMFSEKGALIYQIGKPSTMIYNTALQKLPKNIQKNRILMIGDTPETDIRGAHNIGIDAALITKTGVMTKLIETEGIAKVINHLPQSDKPEFLMKRLTLAKKSI